MKQLAGLTGMGVERRAGIGRESLEPPWSSNSVPIGNTGPNSFRSISGYCLDAFVSHFSLLERIQDGSEKGNRGRSRTRRANKKTCPRFHRRRAGDRPPECSPTSINRLTVCTSVPEDQRTAQLLECADTFPRNSSTHHRLIRTLAPSFVQSLWMMRLL